MKAHFSRRALASSTVALFLSLACVAPALAATLTVNVEGLRNSKGQVSVKLFKNGDEFPKGEAVAKRTVKPSGGKAMLKFDNLEPGTYAMTGYHDENANGEHDRTSLGLPTEGFAFSNDAKPEGAAPDFQAASFKLKQDMTVTLRMQYFADKKN